MRASSTAYCAEIRPDVWLRRFVLATAILVALLGALAISLATVPIWVRLPALVAWIALSYCEIGALRRGWRRSCGVRLYADGSVDIRSDGGAWESAELADGSILLRRFGWLRLVAADGAPIHELVRGGCREDREWRRLHVIWRHV